MSKNQNPAIKARVHFLHEASSILPEPLSKFYGISYKHLAQRVVYRCPNNFKRTTCKGCGIFLDENTSTTSVENTSKERKPHADVKVVTCRSCNRSKRFPLVERKQKNRSKV